MRKTGQKRRSSWKPWRDSSIMKTPGRIHTNLVRSTSGNTVVEMGVYPLLTKPESSVESMPDFILVDAGPLIALFDRDDKYHDRIVDFIKEAKYKFITTTAVVTEVTHMLDFSVNAQIDFLEWIMKEGVILQEISQRDVSRIIGLTKKYSDRPMDFADATLVIAAEQTGVRQIMSIGSDFDIYRLPGKVKIRTVFLD
ncbi:MAG: hypothetical protein R6V62_03485 [Candidatus Fermentibacteraceae bacterium]